MPMLSKDKVITGNGVIKETPPDKHDKTLEPRTSDGRFKKGVSGNPNGRPKKDDTIVERFRSNEGCQSVINKLFAVANTLDDHTPHKDAIQAAKLIVERLVPSLKASELRVDTDGDAGMVYLPSQEEPEKE